MLKIIFFEFMFKVRAFFIWCLFMEVKILLVKFIILVLFYKLKIIMFVKIALICKLNQFVNLKYMIKSYVKSGMM